MSCASGKENLICMSDVKDGKTVKIASIDGGWEYRKRITGLGFVKGCEVKVLRNESKGPLVVKVKGSKFVLGRGEASRIFVES